MPNTGIDFVCAIEWQKQQRELRGDLLPKRYQKINIRACRSSLHTEKFDFTHAIIVRILADISEIWVTIFIAVDSVFSTFHKLYSTQLEQELNFFDEKAVKNFFKLINVTVLINY